MLKEILIVILGVILGIFGAYKTNWERNIYLQYFKYLISIIAFLAIITFFINREASLLLFFMAAMLLSWKYSTKYFKIRK